MSSRRFSIISARASRKAPTAHSDPARCAPVALVAIYSRHPKSAARVCRDGDRRPDASDDRGIPPLENDDVDAGSGGQRAQHIRTIRRELAPLDMRLTGEQLRQRAKPIDHVLRTRKQMEMTRSGRYPGRCARALPRAEGPDLQRAGLPAGVIISS